MTARDDVLAKVRAALAPSRNRGDDSDGRGSHGGDATASGARSARSSIPPTSTDPAAMLDLFAERVADYRATVTRCAATDLAAPRGPPGARRAGAAEDPQRCGRRVRSRGIQRLIAGAHRPCRWIDEARRAPPFRIET